MFQGLKERQVEARDPQHSWGIREQRRSKFPTQKYYKVRSIQSLGHEDPLEKGMTTHSSLLPGESHGQRSQAGYSLCG